MDLRGSFLVLPMLILFSGCGESPEHHESRLKQVGTALVGFHQRNDVFPLANGLPAVGARIDEEGVPAKIGLSWRVHLLPLLGHVELYGKFNLDEPWDSPQNKALIDQMPAVYNSPGVSEPGKTSLHAIIFELPNIVTSASEIPPRAIIHSCFFSEAQSLMFDPSQKEKPFRQTSCIDGTANTIALIEAGSDVATEWTRPGGLKMGPGNCKECLGDISGGFYAVLASGDVRSLGADIEEDLLEALVTANGLETIDGTTVHRLGE
ncbi:MAG: DUF1559 domain-containing protein [Planctomycetaceae bacterium]|nr:DUF1559 domain-containing protein [Planctomycetaceae bacterium]